MRGCRAAWPRRTCETVPCPGTRGCSWLGAIRRKKGGNQPDDSSNGRASGALDLRQVPTPTLGSESVVVGLGGGLDGLGALVPARVVARDRRAVGVERVAAVELERLAVGVL